MLFKMIFIYPSVFEKDFVIVYFFVQFTEPVFFVATRKIPAIIVKAEILLESLEFFDCLRCHNAASLDTVKLPVCSRGEP